jgi:hypothetical protein
VRVPQPPVAVALRFIDCINRGDLAGLAAVLADAHRLQIFTEEPVAGRVANEKAWSGYLESFPEYVIYPRRIAEVTDGLVAILGHTTGSHLGLPDDEESQQTLIWLAEAAFGRLSGWTLIDDTPEHRRRYSLDA